MLYRYIFQYLLCNNPNTETPSCKSSEITTLTTLTFNHINLQPSRTLQTAVISCTTAFAKQSREPSLRGTGYYFVTSI